MAVDTWVYAVAEVAIMNFNIPAGPGRGGGRSSSMACLTLNPKPLHTKTLKTLNFLNPKPETLKPLNP